MISKVNPKKLFVKIIAFLVILIFVLTLLKIWKNCEIPLGRALLNDDFDILKNSAYDEFHAIEYANERVNNGNFLIFKDSGFPYYSKHKFISSIDPSLTNLYLLKKDKEIHKYLISKGLTHIYLPNLYEPHLYKTKLLDFISNPDYASIKFHSKGYKIIEIRKNKISTDLQNYPIEKLIHKKKKGFSKIKKNVNVESEFYLSQIFQRSATKERLLTGLYYPNFKLDIYNIAYKLDDWHKYKISLPNIKSDGMIDVYVNEFSHTGEFVGKKFLANTISGDDTTTLSSLYLPSQYAAFFNLELKYTGSYIKSDRLDIKKFIDNDSLDKKNYSYFSIPSFQNLDLNKKVFFQKNSSSSNLGVDALGFVFFKNSPRYSVQLNVKIPKGKDFIFNTEITGIGLYKLEIKLINENLNEILKVVNILIDGKHTLSNIIMPNRYLDALLTINVSRASGSALSNLKETSISKINVYNQKEGSSTSLLLKQ